MADLVVIGVGNRMMGDDAVGPVALDRLEGRVPETVSLVESVGDATHLIDTWSDAGRVILIDAVVSGGASGSIRRIDAKGGLPKAWRSASTHLVGVAEAIELGKVLGALPDALIVYGIEIGKVAAGVGLSPEVDDAADRVVGMIVTELAVVGSP